MAQLAAGNPGENGLIVPPYGGINSLFLGEYVRVYSCHVMAQLTLLLHYYYPYYPYYYLHLLTIARAIAADCPWGQIPIRERHEAS